MSQQRNGITHACTNALVMDGNAEYKINICIAVICKVEYRIITNASKSAKTDQSRQHKTLPNFYTFVLS